MSLDEKNALWAYKSFQEKGAKTNSVSSVEIITLFGTGKEESGKDKN